MIIEIPVDEDHPETETSECCEYRDESSDEPDSKARPAIEPRPEVCGRGAWIMVLSSKHSDCNFA